MTITLGAFDPMILDEIDTRSCNFAARLASGETITAAVVTTEIVSGTDPAAASLPLGPATITGAIVTQLLDGGAAGVDGGQYVLTFTATTSTGRELIETARMAFRASP